MSYSALDPVSAGVYAALNVSALTTLAPGGVSDHVRQNTAYPCVLYVVQERDMGTFGSKAGTGQRVLEIDLRVHVFSTYAGMLEAQQVMAKVIDLLATAPTVTGYAVGGIRHDETIPLPGETVAGVRVNEVVANFRLWITET